MVRFFFWGGADSGNSPISSVRITGFSPGIRTRFLPSTKQWCSKLHRLRCLHENGYRYSVFRNWISHSPYWHLQCNCTTFLIPNLRFSFIKWTRTAFTIPAVLFSLTSTYSFPKLIIQHDTAAQKHRDLKQLLHVITYTRESRRNPNSQYNWTRLAAARPPRRLCYHSAVFFYHHRLNELSLPQGKIRLVFQNNVILLHDYRLPLRCK